LDLLQDFDEDGWPELLVTADYGDSKMFWNKDGKTFVECTSKCGLLGEQVLPYAFCLATIDQFTVPRTIV
jgi:hypothetical protein